MASRRSRGRAGAKGSGSLQTIPIIQQLRRSNKADRRIGRAPGVVPD